MGHDEKVKYLCYWNTRGRELERRHIGKIPGQSFKKFNGIINTLKKLYKPIQDKYKENYT